MPRPLRSSSLRPELLFQQVDLCANRGLLQAKPCTGTCDRALVRNRIEVEQMMVVQSFHGRTECTSLPPRPAAN